jgi:hypothetical protein
MSHFENFKERKEDERTIVGMTIGVAAGILAGVAVAKSLDHVFEPLKSMGWQTLAGGIGDIVGLALGYKLTEPSRPEVQPVRVDG